MPSRPCTCCAVRTGSISGRAAPRATGMSPAPGLLQDGQRVADDAVDVGVPGDTGDRAQVEPGMPYGEQQGQGVVDTGVAVDDHRDGLTGQLAGVLSSLAFASVRTLTHHRRPRPVRAPPPISPARATDPFQQPSTRSATGSAPGRRPSRRRTATRSAPASRAPITAWYGTSRAARMRAPRLPCSGPASSARSPGRRPAVRARAARSACGVGDRQHHQLHRRQPGREGAAVRLDEVRDRPLHAADDAAVDHDRAVLRRRRRRCSAGRTARAGGSRPGRWTGWTPGRRGR